MSKRLEVKAKLIVTVSFVIIAASVDAATLSLRWQHTSDTKITLAPSQSAVIEVVLEDMLTGDTLSGAYFSLEAIPNDPVTHVSNATGLNGWNAGGAIGLPLGNSQFAVGSNLAGGPNDFDGPLASVVLGSFAIHLSDVGAPIGTEYEIAFDQTANNHLVRSDGSFWAFTWRIAYISYSGYWTYGQGSPGDCCHMYPTMPRDPLIIRNVPEPASVLLLAACGVAVFMRQRR